MNQVHLTQRELEVLQLAAQGFASKAIADKLYTSKRTVDFHLANIYEKFEVNSRSAAIFKAMQAGILTM